MFLNSKTNEANDKTKNEERQERISDDKHELFRIEIDLMDKIYNKKYLRNTNDSIPATLRVLSIDLPELRSRFSGGECKFSHSDIFFDGVASPKIINVPTAGEKTLSKNGSSSFGRNIATKTLKISQKTLVKSIVRCSSIKSEQKVGNVGVELIEASISNLNRYKLRKKQSFGNYTYDPLKYDEVSKGSITGSTDIVGIKGKDYEIDKVNGVSGDDDVSNEIDIKDRAIFNETNAPWNQTAWMEELRLRITGRVCYDSALEKSSTYERILFGRQYKTTIPAVHRIWDFFTPFSFAKCDPDGIDGRGTNNNSKDQRYVRACNKPHAVIANGAALQLVPSSFRLLQKECKNANVPLFIVHDPRHWGKNTQESFNDALMEVRSIVKNRLIENALKQQGSSAFTRGRMLGQIETEAKYQIKEKVLRTKELLGLDHGRWGTAFVKEDWSQNDSETLEKNLIERKVIQMVDEDTGETINKETKMSQQNKTYSPALIEIAKQCIPYDVQNEGVSVLTDTSDEIEKDEGKRSAESFDEVGTID